MITCKQSILFDDGYSFGRGCFETILVKDKGLFLEEHIKRLNSSLKTLGIDKVISKKEVEDKIKEMNLKNMALKIMVSKDNIIFTKRNIGYAKKQYEDGFDVKFTEVRRNESSNLTYIKSLNYLENILEKEKGKKEGYDEIIFLNTKNYLAEGAVSNVFFVKNNKIYTPSVKSGILPGIIRGFLIDNIETIGYNILEGDFTKEDILNSDGAFLTNSLMGIMKISSIDNIKIKESNIIEKIQKYYLSKLR